MHLDNQYLCPILPFCYNTYMSHENIDPIMPPEGDGHGSRFESADLNIDELKDYILDTTFEDESALVEVLTTRYGMARREGLGEVETHMTRRFRIKDVRDAYKKIMQNEEVPDIQGEPVSGEEPQELLSLFLSTADDNEFTLKIYKVLNRNQKSRFEYVLE